MPLILQLQINLKSNKLPQIYAYWAFGEFGLDILFCKLSFIYLNWSV